MRLMGATAAAVAGLAWAGSALAGTASVGSTTGRDSYLARLDTIVGELTALSDSYLARSTGTPTGIQLAFNPSESRDVVTGLSGFNVVDADWARANLRLYDLYVALGGNEINATQQFRRSGSQFYVGLDGTGGQWFAGLSDAQGYMFKLLVERSAEILRPVKNALEGTSANDISTVLASAREAMLQDRAVVARGVQTTLTIQGNGFSNQNGVPVVIGPRGVTVTGVSFVSSTQINATVRVEASAALGLDRFHVYNAGQPFMAVDNADVLVVDGTGTLAAVADDHGATVATATAIAAASSTAGRIETAGDADLFAVTLGSAGTLTLSSTGPSDVRATLEDGAGTVLATNDDGGTWYNFSFSQALAAGTYYVRVSHCCQGIGDYTLTASVQ